MGDTGVETEHTIRRVIREELAAFSVQFGEDLQRRIYPGRCKFSGDGTVAQCPPELTAVSDASKGLDVQASTEGTKRINLDLMSPSNRSEGGKGLFEFRDTEALKARIRQRVSTNKYDVYNFYREDSTFSYIAKHSMFEYVALGVIIANAAWMGVDTDRNEGSSFLQSEPIFQVVDALFTVFFTVELGIRFLAFQSKWSCLKSAWFVFDFILVSLMHMEVVLFTIIMAASSSQDTDESPLGNTAVLRLFRLLRLSRLTKLCRSMPELMILIKGMLTAMKSVSYVMGLLLLLIYVFGIAFSQLSWGYLREAYFRNVAGAMFSLVVHGTFLDNLADFANDVREEAPWLLMLFSVFVVLACLTLMNMLIGILCEVVKAVADEEKEELQATRVYSKFSSMLANIDSDRNGLISFTEFEQMMVYEDIIWTLKDMQIDPVGMVDFAEEFFMENGTFIEITIERFMEMVLALRGTRVCTMKDLMLMSRTFKERFAQLDAGQEALLRLHGVSVATK